jgi:hypothetical protein
LFGSTVTHSATTNYKVVLPEASCSRIGLGIMESSDAALSLFSGKQSLGSETKKQVITETF